MGGDVSSDVKFDRVPFAYRFVKHKPPPQLLLRGSNRNINYYKLMKVYNLISLLITFGSFFTFLFTK